MHQETAYFFKGGFKEIIDFWEFVSNRSFKSASLFNSQTCRPINV